MPLTLDPRCALLVVDLQQGILPHLPEPVRDNLVATASKLATAFHDAGQPVVWIRATGLPPGRTQSGFSEPAQLPDNFTDLDTRLPVRDGDLHLRKDRAISAFVRTDLAEQLRQAGVTQTVLCGTAAGMGVESAARSAFDEGFNVTVVADAVADADAERMRLSLEHAVVAMGTVATSDEVVAALSAV